MKNIAHWYITLLFMTAWPVANADTLRVAVASNFADTLRELAGIFEQQTGHKLQLVAGSTGKHYAQISNSAPFDVFLAADTARPIKLEEAGFGVADSRFTYALGRLVLWSSLPDKIDTKGNVLLRGNFKRLAIANPHLAPYGRAARDVLESIKLWDQSQLMIVRGENIAQTFQFVHSGNVELGFVAWSQLIRKGKTPQGSWWIVPQMHYRPIEQQALQLSDTLVARAFMKFLLSTQAQAVIEAHGYGIP